MSEFLTGGESTLLASQAATLPRALRPPTSGRSIDRLDTVVDEKAIDSPEAALERDDATRLRTISVWGGATCLTLSLALPVLGGDPLAMLVHLGGLAVAFVVCVWTFLRIRRDANYRTIYSNVLAHVAALAVGSGFYFWGPFSGVIICVPIAALMLAQSRTISSAVWIGVSYMGTHMVLSLLIITGVIEDRGFTLIGDRPLIAQLVRLAAVQMIMLSTFLVARKIRRSAKASLEQLEDALLAINRRDALLAEAQRDRAEALRINKPGRYTGEIFDDYKLGMVIGRGAMGVVYEAHHKHTGEAAAVKLLHPHLLAKPEQFRRFARELKIGSALSDPHFVKVFALTDDGDSFPYLVMERLCGHALSDYLTDRVVLEPDEVVDLVRQVGRGLSAAHGAGIIHRDLKPRNLFRLSRPEADVRWKILDFGTCKCVDEEATLTDDGHVLGTPAYMAPEQARGARVDFRADLYSLGVIAYRTLTGRPPFDNREVTGLLYDVVYSMPPQPTMLRTMHRDVDRVFAIALAKHPYERLDCAEALATALESAFRGELSADLRARGDALMAAFPFCGVTPPTVH